MQKFAFIFVIMNAWMSSRVCFKLYSEIYTNKEKTDIGVPKKLSVLCRESLSHIPQNKDYCFQ